MKIAVCIPSFNEASTIQHVTQVIDQGLSNINDISAVIVNCDNNSPDGTNDLFNMTVTICRKVSIVDKRLGKGINILNFFNYCVQNDIDYAMTFDSDLVSIDSSWIDKYYHALLNGNDFVLPKYKRNYQEGNTTNHFIGPVLFKKYGVFIRQPIGGDYGFNRKFIDLILEQNFTPNILNYGIDIFMVVNAIMNHLQISEVDLGYKIHKSSILRMEDIFESVLRGFSEVSKQFPNYDNNKERIRYQVDNYQNKKLTIPSEVKSKYDKYTKKYGLSNYQDILKTWNELINEYLGNIINPSEELIDKMTDVFICRAVSFWQENENNSEWEKRLINELY